MDLRRDFRTAVIWIGVAFAAFILWRVRLALAVAFAAILGAIFLRLLTRRIRRLTGLSDGWSLATAMLLVGIAFGCTAWVFGTEITDQFGQVVSRMQTAVQSVEGYLHRHGLAGGTPEQQAVVLVRDALSALISISLQSVEIFIILVITSICLAVEPEMYRHGVAKLFRRDLRAEIAEGLRRIGASLELWLLARLILMALVGALSLIAVWLIGLPSPVAIALIAGITEIVPYLGPIVGAVPAVLVAMTQGLGTTLWTVAAYIGIHLIEGYLAAPVLQRYFIRVPPALVLIGFLVAGLIFGEFGIIIAAPLTAAVLVAVKVFYMHDTPGEKPELQTRNLF